MSNVVKWQYAKPVEDNNTRLIDSNLLLIGQMAKQKKEKAPDGEAAPAPVGFTAGLAAEAVEQEPEPEIDYVALAKEEAEQMRSTAIAEAETILIRAKEEAENLKVSTKQEAERKGYEEGMAKAQAEEAKMRQQFEQRRQALEQDYQQKLAQMEPDIVGAVIKVFDRVFHTSFCDKQEILLYLIQKTVQNAKESGTFRIRVSEEDYEFIRKYRQEIIQRVGGEITLDILSDETMAESQCMIDTDEGIFDCSVDVQLDNLIKDLQLLSCMA